MRGSSTGSPSRPWPVRSKGETPKARALFRNFVPHHDSSRPPRGPGICRGLAAVPRTVSYPAAELHDPARPIAGCSSRRPVRPTPMQKRPNLLQERQL